jgi:tRNA (guanine37-N1)-methyltransferase
MNIFIVTLFPEMIEQVLDYGVLGRAKKNGQLKLECFNPRDYTEDKHRTVDDRPYGGGPGMLMKVEPLCRAIQAAKAAGDGDSSRVIYLSPQGRKIDQSLMVETAEKSIQGESLILVAGRYEGIDERVINTLIDEEWSIGDYVLSGGEYAALVVIDAITRLLPGALGDEASAEEDSFMQGLLDCPHYTRPEVIDDMAVPAVLLSGDHEAIRRWRLKQSLGRTWLRRPELIAAMQADKELWSAEKAALLAEFLQEHEQH